MGKDCWYSLYKKNVVTEKDILAGTIVNQATAEGKDPEGQEITGSDEETKETDLKNIKLLVAKEITNEGFEEGTYKLVK